MTPKRQKHKDKSKKYKNKRLLVGKSSTSGLPIEDFGNDAGREFFQRIKTRLPREAIKRPSQ